MGMPVDTNFVAECYAVGISGGDLNLDSCVVVH